MAGLTKTIARLIKAGFPEGTAYKIATGELDMSNAARMARADEQGFLTDAYHASKQDITGPLVPGYSDGLIFSTPKDEFANNWLGKGKMGQKRVGADDEYAKLDARREALPTPDSDDYDSQEWKDWLDKSQEIYRESGNFGNTVYPLKVREGNSFDPTKNFDDIEEQIRWRNGGSIPSGVEDAARQGNYLMYETPEVVEALGGKGYNSMRLAEMGDGNLDSIASFDPSDVRSRFAAFDPDNIGKNNILGSARPDLLAATALGTAGALAAPVAYNALQEQQHGVLAAPEHPNVLRAADALRGLSRRLEGSPAGILAPDATAEWLGKLAYQQKPTWMDRISAIGDWL